MGKTPNAVYDDSPGVGTPSGEATMVPDVATVVGGITGGATQLLRAGVSGATETTSWLRDTAADTVQLLAGPVVESVNHSVGRVLGAAHNDAATPVRWRN